MAFCFPRLAIRRRQLRYSLPFPLPDIITPPPHPLRNVDIVTMCFFQDFKRAGISRLLKEKSREQFWPEKSNLRRTRKNLKNGQNFTPFGVNKMFSHKF
jgi:hypothetical protein